MIKKIIIGLLSFIIFLQILFLILKLCGAVEWHWFFVFIPSVIVCIYIFILIIITALISASESDDMYTKLEEDKK